VGLLLLKSTKLAINEAITKKAMGMISIPSTPAMAPVIEVQQVTTHSAPSEID